jgi:hypothetical protein
MKQRFVATSIVVALLVLPGCVSNPITEAISSLEVCTKSLRILTDMEEVLRLALANPLAAGTHSDSLVELSDEFKALTPHDADLATAHENLSSQIDLVLETVQSPSVSSLAELPAVITGSQGALLAYAEACKP